MTAELISDARLDELARQTGECLEGAGCRLACAESCTGGWVAKCLTDIPGCSRWFERGFVTYTNQAKQDMLGVEAGLLAAHGAVSEPVVRAMAAGALRHSPAQAALGVSGIAGPGGATADKPVGLVWFGWAKYAPDGSIETRAEQRVFAGDREAVRRQAVAHALRGVPALLA